jgi:sugar/nucleoside kinase (ribokinase family)
MKNAIFVGLSTIDIVYGVDNFPGANSKVVARTQDMFVGGPATNAGVTYAHLGGKVTVVTVAGRHMLANAIREELHRYSIELIDLNADFDGMPVVSSIFVSGTGERSVVSANATRVNALPARVDEKHLGGLSVVLVDGHYMEACQAWASAARSRGIRVVFDGGSWKNGTDELLRNVNTAICSANFLPPGCSSQDQVIEYLKDCGTTDIAITNGAAAVRFVSGIASGFVQVPTAQVVDTAGAGDVFHGAFSYYSSIGHGFVEALEEAAKVAALSCRFSGKREWTRHFPKEQASPVANADSLLQRLRH